MLFLSKLRAKSEYRIMLCGYVGAAVMCQIVRKCRALNLMEAPREIYITGISSPVVMAMTITCDGSV
jgi:hypothetical protein